MSIAHLAARAMLEGTVLDGTLEDRRLATSLFEIPHRVQVTADLRLPYRMRLGLLYSGASGRPFTYNVGGDANADGMGAGLRQDAVYVPRDSLDITLTNPADWSALDAFIRQVPCLHEQRGRILERNSCRNPWFGTLSARVTKAFPAMRGQSLELSADVYNLLNLINPEWGLSRYDGLTFGTDLVNLTGYDPTNGRGTYLYRPPPRGQVDDFASRWQMELSVFPAHPRAGWSTISRLVGIGCCARGTSSSNRGPKHNASAPPCSHLFPRSFSRVTTHRSNIVPPTFPGRVAEWK
jgi:hypothetical protein